jgi:hypothetical protein
MDDSIHGLVSARKSNYIVYSSSLVRRKSRAEQDWDAALFVRPIHTAARASAISFEIPPAMGK